ncbi:hypothetical protein [Methylobacterium sp. CCH5-D2]|uniref:hypothetical protein n=1 Tax=Methylobacterium sp. CCH5-D2 TaxID=1768765 RepID=UPI000B2AF3F4|nr:hypothetical protein [Methylobacterium sp. CCH5-D2]
MALLSEMVQAVAGVEGIEPVSVGIFARHAREAGLITQGGRGRSAAKMSFKDAANLLIAVNGCALAKEVASGVTIYRNLRPMASEGADFVGVGAQGSTFGSDFEVILRMMAEEGRNKIPGATFVRFFKPYPLVEITMHPQFDGVPETISVKYGDSDSGPRWDGPDRSDETVISHVTLQNVASLIAG